MFEWNDVKTATPATSGTDTAQETQSDGKTPSMQDIISAPPTAPSAGAPQSLGLIMALAGLIDIPEEIRQYNQALQNYLPFADPRDVFGKNWAQREPLLFPVISSPYRPASAESFYELAIAMAATAEKNEAVLRRYHDVLRRLSARNAPIDRLYNILMCGEMLKEKKREGGISRLFPYTAEACYSQGNSLLRDGRLWEAVEFFREALRQKPDYAEAHNNLGNVLATLGEHPQALEHYREAVRLKPDYPGAHCNLGNALVVAGNPAEAVGHYQKALYLWPDSPHVHNNLGEAFLLLGKVPEAIAQFREALRLNPDFTEARLNLEKALGASKK